MPSLLRPRIVSATASANLNFQARLETASGAIAPDGNYDVTFHLYNAATSIGSTDTGCGTDANCLWEETYSYNSGPSSSDVRIRVANGYLTANLGSITAFPSINWSQQLYLTMDIGGTTSSGAITWDGQMSPRVALTAVPYAFQAQSATQLQATVAGNLGQLTFDSTMAGGAQTFVLPDQGATGTYHVLTQEKANTGFIQLQGTTPGTAQTGNFNVTGTGIVGGLTVTNSGNVAFQRGTDFSASGISNNVNFGGGELIRLTGASTQTITGIANGVDGRILTIVNAASQAATISNLNASSSSANQIVTGTGSDLTLAAGASIYLVYDSAASLWHIVGGSGGTGGNFMQLQATSPGIQQTGNFNISGTGILSQLQSSDTSTGSTNSPSLTIRTGNATGATSNSGNLTLDVGTATGSLGAITIGHSGVITTAPGTLIVQGANALTLGSASNVGAALFLDGTADGFVGTLNVATLTANRTITIPDATGIVCLENAAACGFAPTTGGSGYIQLQASTPGTAQTGNFNITGTGLAGTINATSGFQFNGTAGSSVTCTSGNVVQNAVIAGGIITAGSCVAIPTGPYVQLQASSPGTQQTGNLNISGTAIAGTSILTPSLDTASAGAFTLGASTATAVNIGKTSSNIATTITGTTVIKPSTGNDSTTAFQVQNAGGLSLLTVDSTNHIVTAGQSNLIVSDISVPSSPSASVGSNQGGSLSGAAGTTYYYEITATNALGESLPSAEFSISGSSFTPISTPGAPTLATAAGTTLGIGTYKYEVTFTTANGETSGGTEASVTTTSSNQAVSLTAIPTGPTGTVARKIYRTVVGGASGAEKLVTTINDNTTTTYTDTTADGSLGVTVPSTNNATTNTNNASISWTTVTGATGYRIYRGTTSGSENAYQTSSSSPFTDTGAAGTAALPPTHSSMDSIGIGTSTPSANLHDAGTALFKNTVDSTAAFQIQNAAGNTLLSADTKNIKVTVGSTLLVYQTPTCNYSNFVSTMAGLTPTAYWKLEDTSGTTATDSSGNNDTGTISATGVTLNQTPGPFSCATAHPAMQFTGASSGKITTALSYNNPQSFTLTAIFKTSSAGPLISFTTGSTSNAKLYVGNDGHLYGGFYYYRTCCGGQFSVISSPSTVNDGSWHQAVLAITATGEFMYVDGVQVSSNTTSLFMSGNAANGTAAWEIGAEGGVWNTDADFTQYFTGFISQAAVIGSVTPNNVAVLAGDASLYVGTYGFLGVNTTNPGYPVDVGGDINTSTQYRIGGTVICTSAGCTPAAGSSNYVQLQGTTPGTQQTGYFNISGTGIAGTSVLTPLLDVASAGALTLGSTTATAINLGKTSSNIATTITGTTVIKPTSGHDSTVAFQVQSATGGNLLNVDSTISQITANGGFAVNTSSPSAQCNYSSYVSTITGITPSYYWKLEDTGSTAADSSGNGNTGTIGSGVTVNQTPGPFACATSHPTMAFNGTSNAKITTTALGHPTTFSMSVLFKTSSAGPLVNLNIGDTGGNGNAEKMFVGSDGHLWGGYTSWISCPVSCMVSSPTAVNDGQWHQATLYQSTTTGQFLYLDGSLVASNAGNISPTSTNGTWEIGGASGVSGTPDTTQYFTGDISQVVIAGTVNGSTAASLASYAGISTPGAGVGIGLAGTPRYLLDVGGDVNTSTTYRIAGTSGTSATCSSGGYLQNAVVAGGIITGGTCTSSGAVTLQGSTPGTPDTGNFNISGTGIAATFNATSGFKANGTAGTSLTCTSGQYIQTPVISEGIVTSGTCVSGTGGTYVTLQGSTPGTADTGNLNITGTAIAATINATSGFQLNGTAGSTLTCTGGQYVQNAVINGGIITGGTCITGSGGAYVTLQGSTPGTADTGNFNITGTGIANNLQGTSSVKTPLIDVVSAGALTIGSSTATAINLGKTSSNITTTITGTTLIKPSTGNDSTTAFQVQNAGGAALLTVDSTNSIITANKTNVIVTDTTVPSSPSVSAGSNQGGTLLGGTSNAYYYVVTAITGLGETLASSEVSIAGTSFTPLTAPGAPSLALAAGTNLGTGVYKYEVTFTTANGETTGGTEAVITTTTGNQAVSLTAIPTGPTGTFSRKIYRTSVGGASGTEKLLTTIADNITTTYNDTTADGSLGAAVSTTNTATTNTNNASISWTAVTGATSYRIYRGTITGGESAYQTSASSPFTDTGAAGTSATPPGSSAVDKLGIGTASPTANFHDAGTALFQNVSNSTSAFQIQNAGGSPLLTVDTKNTNITVGANLLVYQTASCSYSNFVTALSNMSPTYYWKLEDTGTTTAVDSSGNADTGTLSAAGVTENQTPGPFSCATSHPGMAFNAASSGRISTATSFTGPNTFSIMAMFKTSTFGPLISFTGGNQDRNFYINTSNQFIFGVNGNGPGPQYNTALDDGNWHMVVGTVSPTGGMLLYVDGKLVASTAYATPSSGTGTWDIGHNSNSGWSNLGSNYFTGKLSQVAIMPSALTAAQVATLAGDAGFYSSSNVFLGVNTNAPVYPVDVVGDVNTSTQYRVGGTVVCTSTGCTPTAGSSNYVQLQASTPGTAQTGNFNINGTGIAANLQGSTSVKTPLLDVASAGALSIGTATATSINIGNTTSNIAITSTGTAIFKPSSGHDSTTAFQVQSAGGGNLFNVDSTISQITVNGGLKVNVSAPNLQCNYSNFTSTITGGSPTGYWKLEDTSGTTAVDSSGNSDTGTISASGVTLNQTPGPFSCGTSHPYMTFNAASSGKISTATSFSNPLTYSEAVLFKTTTGGPIMTFGSAGGYGDELYVGTDGKLYGGQYNGSVFTLTSSTTVTDGSWHLAVLTYASGASGLTLYLDGNQIGHLGLSGNQSFTGQWNVGWVQSASGWPNLGSAFFTGSISQAAVFPAALSAGTVSNLAAYAGFTVGNATGVGIGLSGSPSYMLDVGGDINTATAYRINGSAGSSVTCASGTFLQNPVISGGIITGGTCVAAATAGQYVTLQGSTPGTPDTGNINITGVGIFGTSVKTASLLLGTASTTTGQLVVYSASSANSVTVSVGSITSSYTLTLPGAPGTTGQCLQAADNAGTLTWGKCTDGTTLVVLAPQYPGAVLNPSGSNNTGTMASGYVGGLPSGQGYKHSFYEWSTGQSSAQNDDIMVQYQLPSNFASFATGSWKIWTYVDSLVSTNAQFTLYDSTNTACYASLQSIEPSSATAWQQITLSDPGNGCSFAANGIITLDIKLTAIQPSSNQVKVGDIQFGYN